MVSNVNYEVKQAKMKQYKFLPEEVTEMVNNFKHYDADGNGTVSMKEFCQVLKNLDIKADPNQLFAKFDSNSDGVIAWEEYVDMMGQVK